MASVMAAIAGGILAIATGKQLATDTGNSLYINDCTQPPGNSGSVTYYCDPPTPTRERVKQNDDAEARYRIYNEK